VRFFACLDREGLEDLSELIQRALNKHDSRTMIGL
jgi:hypothetical protein